MKVNANLALTYFKILDIGSLPNAREIIVDPTNKMLYMIYGYYKDSSNVNLWGLTKINSTVGEIQWARTLENNTFIDRDTYMENH